MTASECLTVDGFYHMTLAGAKHGFTQAPAFTIASCRVRNQNVSCQARIAKSKHAFQDAKPSVSCL